MQKIYPLKGVVMNYDWGGYSFIPNLLGQENSSQLPSAEYWMGIHPKGMAKVTGVDGLENELKDLTTTLPYLLKVLDVNDMLSIQVHPSKEEASKGFAHENAAGVPLTATNRNYKDDNYKPELMVALSDFWLLHGFKSIEKINEILLKYNELSVLTKILDEKGVSGLYRFIMEMPQQEVNEILQPLLDRILPLYRDNKLEKSSADFWAARAHLTFSQPQKIDRGIFSIYLFNIVNLKKGEGIFQDFGIPHAYLEGQNVEIMANSDNVLRGGLSTKHIDVQELLKHTKCDPVQPEVLLPIAQSNGENVYQSPAKDFRLSVIKMDKSETITINTSMPDIYLLMEGDVLLQTEAENIHLNKHQLTAFVQPGTTLELVANAPTILFRATVPV